MPPNYRILRQYFGAAKFEEMTETQAREILTGYCDNIQKLLQAMWYGQKFQTAASVWWIEKGKLNV